MKAIWNGHIIAESNEVILLEGCYYFPFESVREEFFKSSTTHKAHPWKGTANFFSLNVGGLQLKDAAFSYPNPSPLASTIKGKIAFNSCVEVKP